VAVIARPKLSEVCDHWGVRLTDWTVLHTTQERGVHVVSYEEFEAGKPVRVVRRVPISEHQSVVWRMHQELANPKTYHLIENNCEILANRVTGHESKSPQVQFWTVVAGLGLVALATARA
jgi:hypothetical protein